MNDLTPAQQATLVNRVRNIIRDIDVTDIAQLIVLIISNSGLKNKILSVTQDFVRMELNLPLV